MNKKRSERLILIEKNLRKYTRGSGYNLEFYVPEIGKWVYSFSKTVRRDSGLNQRHWYNKYILEVDDPEYAPECCKEDCHCKVGSFKGTAHGYPLYCCLIHARTDEGMHDQKSKSIRIAMSKPENKLAHRAAMKKAMSTPEHLRQLSERSTKQWQDEEYRRVNLPKIPKAGRVSKISREFFSILSEYMSLMGLEFKGEFYHGNNEYSVRTGLSVGDIKFMRFLDFYASGLSIIVEFQGDYWHPRDVEKYGIDRVKYSVTNDEIKRLSVLKALPGSRFYYVIESDYRDRGFEVIREILEDIEIYIQCT